MDYLDLFRYITQFALRTKGFKVQQLMDTMCHEVFQYSFHEADDAVGSIQHAARVRCSQDNLLSLHRTNIDKVMHHESIVML